METTFKIDETGRLVIEIESQGVFLRLVGVASINSTGDVMDETTCSYKCEEFYKAEDNFSPILRIK